MGSYVLGLQEIDQAQAAVAGGKGAHLGELSRIEGIRVPAGFCVTTEAFRRAMAQAPSIDGRLDQLSRLNLDDRDAISALSAEIREAVEGSPIPDDLAAPITQALARFGEQAAYAVRSSATAEDSPAASFAGQQDTFLNVAGPAAILEHVRRCWASVFTERAVTYRLRNGFDHRRTHMAVVVQHMSVPHAAGVLFTADPVTSNRKVCSVEATFGLGEALVSGLVNADVYTVRGGDIVTGAVATKQRAIHASAGGGTLEQPIEPALQQQPTLTETQVVALAQLGRRIEAHFGRPQDIEWCLVDDGFHVVQSRPITTLFPIPERADRANHVYVSVGHQQMMTDPMKPLGLSFWQLTTPRPMAEAGGRLFVDVTQILALPASRDGLLEASGRSDPLMRDALQTVLDRGGLVPSLPEEGPAWAPPSSGGPAPIETDPAIVAELIARTQESIANVKSDIQTKSGSELFDFILADIRDRDEDFLDELAELEGGREAGDAIRAYIDKYGMRCVGEIDITRPRWSERPTTLLPMILANVENFEPGTGARRFEQGRQEAGKREQELLECLRALPDGERKAEEAKQMIERLRTFTGYREYPKYGMVSRYFVYKQAVLDEAERLVQADVLRNPGLSSSWRRHGLWNEERCSWPAMM